MGAIAPVRAVVDLATVRATDVGVVGGKGANLGEMIAAGFPVPVGAVVTADAYLDAMDRAGVREELARLTVDVVDGNAPRRVADLVSREAVERSVAVAGRTRRDVFGDPNRRSLVK